MRNQRLHPSEVSRARVRALNADIEDWTEKWNENPQPYVWTKTAEEILESLAG